MLRNDLIIFLLQPSSQLLRHPLSVSPKTIAFAYAYLVFGSTLEQVISIWSRDYGSPAWNACARALWVLMTLSYVAGLVVSFIAQLDNRRATALALRTRVQSVAFVHIIINALLMSSFWGAAGLFSGVQRTSSDYVKVSIL